MGGDCASDESPSDDEMLEVWLCYNPRDTSQSFEGWLNNNLPSNIEKKKGVRECWISVSNPQVPDRFEDRLLDNLLDTWGQWLRVGHPINYQTIKQLALNNNVRTGKWLLFAESGGKIDHLWSIVARGIVNNQLPCIAAKVSMYDKTNWTHVMCIFNDDFTNTDDVMAAEQAIRNIGIKGRLLYKPDVYTYTGIYSKNKWNIRPYIYESVYDILKKTSIIKPVDGVY